MIRYQSLLGVAIGAALLLRAAAPALADKTAQSPTTGQPGAPTNTCGPSNPVTPDSASTTGFPFNPNGTAALGAGVVSPAAAQMPVLVTSPNGSLSYSTPQNGSFINPPLVNSYVTANGGPVLITNPNGSQSYANVNGAPSLVSGPDGSLSYQYVVAGSQSSGAATLGYLNSNNASGPLTSAGTPLGSGLRLVTLAPIAAHGPMVSGRYCDMPDGGQIWIADGAPIDGTTC
jgi:hypothetical protein